MLAWNKWRIIMPVNGKEEASHMPSFFPSDASGIAQASVYLCGMYGVTVP